MKKDLHKRAIEKPIRSAMDLIGPRNIKWMSPDLRFSFCFYVNK